jgi:hypothetical protein
MIDASTEALHPAVECMKTMTTKTTKKTMTTMTTVEQRCGRPRGRRATEIGRTTSENTTTGKEKRMTTDTTDNSTRLERARRIAQVRRLTDPLGAMGHRQTGERIEREAGARRAVFVAALAAFVASLGIIVATAPDPPPPTQPAVPLARSAGNSDHDGSLERPASAPRPHVRTHAS